jgi:hypothetical protein
MIAGLLVGAFIFGLITGDVIGYHRAMKFAKDWVHQELTAMKKNLPL